VATRTFQNSRSRRRKKLAARKPRKAARSRPLAITGHKRSFFSATPVARSCGLFVGCAATGRGVWPRGGRPQSWRTAQRCSRSIPKALAPHSGPGQPEHGILPRCLDSPSPGSPSLCHSVARIPRLLSSCCPLCGNDLSWAALWLRRAVSAAFEILLLLRRTAESRRRKGLGLTT